jgi:hypothetical protein
MIQFYRVKFTCQVKLLVHPVFAYIGIEKMDNQVILLVEANFNGTKGQPFTDMPGHFKGSVDEVFHIRLDDNFKSAVFVSP